MPKFNNVELTQGTILKTRELFCDIYRQCIDDVLSGETKVNDPDGYIKWRKQSIELMSSGASDFSFTFLQRAYWVQTGENVALLP